MSNHGANMEFFDPHNDQDDENQQPSSLGTINHSNIPLISDLGILLQGAQNCYTTDMGTQASNYSDVLNLLSSFGHASPVSAQKSDYIPCTVNILHDGERDECSDSRRNTEDSMGIQHSPSEEYTPAQDLKMSSECKSLKRRRSAEVHNFTERLRRQRLKDKMKALQELIPNCSKRDKASTLDEAINYIKKLQYHVEMMSMGSGFTMFRAPWTIPAAQQGMQQIPGLSSLQRDGYGLGLGIEMPGPPSANFLTNQLGLPLVSSGFMGLQGTSGMTSSGNVVDALLFTTSSTTSWVPPSSTQWETSRS